MPQLFLLVLLWCTALDDRSPLEPLGRLDVKLVPEASGIVKSRRHAGVFWVHNDSGNPPSLFAIHADGRIIREFRIDVPNIDWEDIAIDDQGHLFIGDIGNNLGALPARAIYRIDEPDPAQPPHAPLKATAVSRYALPRDNRFDAESLDFDQGKAIVIAKYRDGREAEIFSVAFDPPSPLFKLAEPRSLGRLTGFIEPATGSDLDADRTHLAVCSPAVTRIYRREDLKKHEWMLISEVRYPAAQFEGICWDGRDLILVAEGGGVFRIAEKTWRGSPPRRSIAPTRPEPARKPPEPVPPTSAQSAFGPFDLRRGKRRNDLFFTIGKGSAIRARVVGPFEDGLQRKRHVGVTG